MVLWYSTHQIIWSMSGVYSILATLITSYLIYNHLRNWTEPRFQKPIVRILLMVPIYAIDSWLSIVFYNLSVFFDVARDCIVSTVYGGRRNLIQMLEEKDDLKHPWPFCCLPPLKTGKGFFLLCKRMVMQFVIVKPILSALTFILELFHAYHEGSFSLKYGYIYITTIDNISISIALYFLVIFYMPIWAELQPFRPLPKFLCIKTVIFFSFWQGVAVAILVAVGAIKPEENYTVENLSAFIQDALICVEMFVLSLAMTYAFNPDTYLDPNRESLLSNPSGVIKPIIKNLSTVVSVKDVVNDTVDTFGRELVGNK